MTKLEDAGTGGTGPDMHKLFAQPFDRHIEGVIKADDMRSDRTEMEEYVLTADIERQLQDFMQAYIGGHVNGAWISGYFGSGKSHLLKMLAFLLANRELEGASAWDLFLPKCKPDALASADLERARRQPAVCLLFNIDQKVTGVGRDQMDSLLAVFVRVFNEMRGFSGKDGHVAQFESDLVEKGIYEAFREAYEKESGLPWEKGRNKIFMEEENIDRAYCLASGLLPDSERNILQKYEQHYRLSIGDFADMVGEWLEHQGKNERIIFLIDEVGQFIGENSQLMLNLQTLAESLSSRCGGRAWIIVTAQEALEKVLVNMSQSQSNDFSKIQGRFNLRLSLGSRDVDEVIKKRLLGKSPQGEELLGSIYEENRDELNSLFDFGEGTASLPRISDGGQFVAAWPFLPYQFQLFQDSLNKLSIHNAFQGRHRSVGERSMLGIFQEVLKEFKPRGAGSLVSFDLLYDGMRGSLRGQIQLAIANAEKVGLDPFAIRVLKALFLVKYVHKFKATPRNVSVLLRENLAEDALGLQKRVEGALELLERETLVAHSGQEYAFLTDAEKDVEEEIKNETLETEELYEELGKIVYEQILNKGRIRHKCGNAYGYARKVDSHQYGRKREEELSINIITSQHEYFERPSLLATRLDSANELLVFLPPDKNLLEGLGLYLKTERYLRQNLAGTADLTRRQILERRQSQNLELARTLAGKTGELLAKADIFVGGTARKIPEGDAAKRIEEAFLMLVDKVYTNLRMVENYSNQGQSHMLQEEFSGEAAPPLAEAESEALARIKFLHQRNDRISVKSLLETLQRRPYGWPGEVIIDIVARLAGLGLVEARLNGESLDADSLKLQLANSRQHQGLALQPLASHSPEALRALKNALDEVFNLNVPTDSRQLLAQVRRELAAMAARIEELLARKEEYPFLAALDTLKKRTELCLHKPDAWYFSEFPDQARELASLKNQLLEPAASFLGGPQKEIYNAARQFLQKHEADAVYLQDSGIGELRELLNAPDLLARRLVPAIRQKREALAKAHAQKLAEALARAREELAARKAQLEKMPEFAQVPAPVREELLAAFEVQDQKLASQGLIIAIERLARDFEEKDFRELAARLYSGAASSQEGEEGSLSLAQDREAIVLLDKIRPDFDKPFLENPADVEAWLGLARQRLLEEIARGRKVQI